MKECVNNSGWYLLMLVLSAMLSSCAVKDGAPESYYQDWRTIEDAKPRDEPYSRYGNPDSYQVFGQHYQVMRSNAGFNEKGLASWYGTKFHGQRTSSGETYDMYAMTAAHKTLRIPSYVEVTNLRNNRKAIVKVNDRGPFHEGRVIDLSYAAATKLGVAETGVAPVVIRVIDVGKKEKKVVDNNALKTARVGKPVVKSPATPAEAVLGSQFYVQVAAFSSEENAMRMLNNLKYKKFTDVKVHAEGELDKRLFRVRIGPVSTEAIAEKIMLQLKEFNHSNVRIVALITN